MDQCVLISPVVMAAYDTHGLIYICIHLSLPSWLLLLTIMMMVRALAYHKKSFGLYTSSVSVPVFIDFFTLFISFPLFLLEEFLGPCNQPTQMCRVASFMCRRFPWLLYYQTHQFEGDGKHRSEFEISLYIDPYSHLFIQAIQTYGAEVWWSGREHLLLTYSAWYRFVGRLLSISSFYLFL